MSEINLITPVIIIGAPRSGTNILRDCVSRSSFIKTWDCDEINSIWKFSNYHRNDDLEKKDLTQEIKVKIQKSFLSIAKQKNVSFVLEKTCANCLRLDFVHAALPNAKFILLFRDGHDVIPSAIKRSSGEFSGNKLMYRIKKMRYAPASYLIFLLRSLFSSSKRISSWGPQNLIIQKHRDDKEKMSLVQWRECVENTVKYFSKIDKQEYISVYYDELVDEPKKQLRKIFEFLNIDLTDEDVITMSASVNRKMRNEGWEYSEKNSKAEVNRINKLIQDFIKAK